jgi:peroxiredoxin
LQDHYFRALRSLGAVSFVRWTVTTLLISVTTDGTAKNASANSWLQAPRNYIIWAGVLLLVASVMLNVLLARKVQFLLHLDGSSALLKVGTSVPAITAKRVNGTIETIGYFSSDRPTVLYVFTPSCSWCERNLENIKALIEFKGAEYRFVGLSLSGKDISSYLVAKRLVLATYTDLPRDILETYKLHGTPQTIVISPQGRVIQNWAGAYVGDLKSDVEVFFHVSLPGTLPLQESPPSPLANPSPVKKLE